MGRIIALQFKILFLHFLLTFFQVAVPESRGFSLKLIPWDSPKSPLYQPNLTQTQKYQMMIMSSKTRALKSNTSEANAMQIPMSHQDLRYSVNIKIGKQGTEVTLLLDTGSGPIWTRCQQSRSDFNPAKSKTYRTLPCQHPLCQKAKDICKCIDGKCVCKLSYGIKGGMIIQVQATLSSDSFTLPMKNNSLKTFSNIVFGCSTHSPIYSGILGLNKLPVSLISQVKKSIQGRYSYCLYGQGGYLRFGKDIPKVGKNAKSTKILHPNKPTLFMDLIDISVSKKRMGLSPALFSYEQGGFFIDTGAPLTVLKKQAYDRVIQEFAKYFKGRLERANETQYRMHPCYKYNPSMKSYPSMTFHLKGADYEISNLYITPEPGIICIGLMPGEVSLLGAYQQWNKRFIFDINANVMKFVDEDCSKDQK